MPLSVQPNTPLAQDVYNVATQYGIPPALLAALVQQESGGDPTVVSQDPGGTHGFGLTQLTNPTLVAQAGSGLFDPIKNLQVGAQYLRSLFNGSGNWWNALAGYNGSTAYADQVTALWQQYTNANIFNGYSAGPNQSLGSLAPPHFLGGASALSVVPSGTWPVQGSSSSTSQASSSGFNFGSVPFVGGIWNGLGQVGNAVDSAGNSLSNTGFIPASKIASDLGVSTNVGGVLSAVGGWITNLSHSLARWVVLIILGVAILVLIIKAVTGDSASQQAGTIAKGAALA